MDFYKTRYKGIRWILLVFLTSTGVYSQDSVHVLDKLRSRLDSVKYFEADARLDVDISYVNMPVKNVHVIYRDGAALEIESDDFVMLPKKGLDLTLKGVFSHPYVSLSMGQVSHRNIPCQLIKLIPEGSKADFTIASLWIDINSIRVVQSEISTKKNGVFTFQYIYSDDTDILPKRVEVEFEVSDIKIPLRFLASDSEIDPSKLRKSKDEKGVIYIELTDYRIRTD